MNTRGFVFIELIIILGIMSVLVAIASVAISDFGRTGDITAGMDTMIIDIKSQQTKAMSGLAAHGAAETGYGIKFDSAQYTLFTGDTYSVSDPANVVVLFKNQVRATSNLPDDSIIFAPRSGEVVGYDGLQDTLVLTQLNTGQTKTIEWNRYGTIVSVNE